ncbi:MAG TPA: ABC transporter permease [Bacteroidales bacterium]|nr:ABC transporter permease [Bacteroidales bacterium]
MIKHILITSIKDFTNNKSLFIINLVAIVLALVLITMASSWIYLSLNPISPIEKAKSFYQIRAFDETGIRQSVSLEDCEIINRSVKNGFAWYYGQLFSLVTVNRNNNRIDYRITSTDANFWKALNFKFLKGGPFSEDQFRNKEYVVVMSERFANAYFGSTDILGMSFIYGKLNFKIAGIFRSNHTESEFKFDLYVPHSIIPEDAGKDVNAYFLINNKEGKNELEFFLKKYKPTGGNQISTVPYLSSMLDIKNNLHFWATLLISFLLPILCFSNMFTRKMELKIPEMAIKRAFGASRKYVFINLVAINVFYVLIAGVLAMMMAHPLIGFAFNPTGSASIETGFLFLKFYISTILLYIVFGVVSAIHPAWKVSGESIISNV